MTEKIFVGTTHNFELKDEIYAKVRVLRNYLSGNGSVLTITVLRFADLDEIKEVFENGGKKLFQRYEQSLKEKLATLKRPIEKFNFERNYPEMLKDFNEALKHIKQAYDALVQVLPKEAIKVADHIHLGKKIGFTVDYDTSMFDEVLKAKTKVYIETPEQLKLYELCQKVCELCNEIQSMQTKPSWRVPEPLNLFMYKDEFAKGRKTIINPSNLINYFKIL